MPKPREVMGKKVRERYGRFTGTVVAYESNPLGEVTSIVYESSGMLIRTDSNSFHLDGGEIEIAPSSIIEFKSVYEELSNLLIRIEALNKLKSNQLISEESYKKVSGELDSIYKALEEKSASIISKLSDREGKLLRRKEWMYNLFMNLEISRRMDWISDEEYIKAYEYLEKEFFRTTSEIDDVKRAKIDLESTLEMLRKTVSRVEVEEHRREEPGKIQATPT